MNNPINRQMAIDEMWIPCKEKPPSDRTEVIVSCHDDSGDTPFDYTSCGWMITDGGYWIVDNDINNFVVAWMPLPKPYKEITKVADTVEVVRCKDCRFADAYYHCVYTNFWENAEDYCSRGEKKYG